MATFQIFEDTEKENPAASGILKETRTVLGGGSHNLKPAYAGQIHQIQTRSSLAVLNTNANMGKGLPGATVPHGGNKLTLRQTNHNNNNKNINKNGNLLPFGEQKKTVEPLKSFSDYFQVDHANDVYVKSIQEKISTKTTVINKTGKTTTTATINIQEKNVYASIKNDSLHKDFGGIIDNKTVFNTTPMSVSDVLSPMSVDRSNLSILNSSTNKENRSFSLEQLEEEEQTNDDDIVDENDIKSSENQQNSQLSKIDTEQQQQQTQQRDKAAIPRNDRQRFFEVVEYQNDILDYFRVGEKKHRPKPHYMRRQQDINYSMRTILVDWLVEVSEEYNLDTETLYLCVSYIDRFLSHMSVVRSKLQLVGTAAMYIAAKYEEIYPPDVGEFVFITDDTYTKAQVLRMEQLILKMLSFDLCTPTPYVFVNTYAVITDMTDQLKFLTMYICELSLLEADPYLRFVPSLISAAALALARYVLDFGIWSTQLEEITKYRLEDLKEVFLYLCKTHSAASSLPQQAIFEKYRNKKYNEVSNIKGVDFTPEHYDEITFKYNELIAAEITNVEQQQAMVTANNENVRRMISLMFN